MGLTEANGPTRVRVDGTVLVIATATEAESKGIPRISADPMKGIAILEITTNGGGGIQTVQAAERIQRDGFRNVTSRNVVSDNNPGRNDFVHGEAADWQASGMAPNLDFSCP